MPTPKESRKYPNPARTRGPRAREPPNVLT